MRNTSVDALPGIAPGETPVARGGALRTFGGLALLLVVALFVLGAYLIEDQFYEPACFAVTRLIRGGGASRTCDGHAV